MAAPHGEPSLPQPAVGSHAIDWNLIDDEFRVMLLPIQLGLNLDEMTTSEANEAFTAPPRSSRPAGETEAESGQPSWQGSP